MPDALYYTSYFDLSATMARLLELSSFADPRGSLTVIEKVLPFAIQRVYYIYNTNQLPRAGHAHLFGDQALVCLHKLCDVTIKTGQTVQTLRLSSPNQCLIIEAREWHELAFEPGASVLVLASTHYNAKNYTAAIPKV